MVLMNRPRQTMESTRVRSGHQLLVVNLLAATGLLVGVNAFTSPSIASASVSGPWTQRHPATSPPPLQQASTAYDQDNGDVVVYGGLASDGKALNDIWTWNGSVWTQKHPTASPPGRYGASAAYDQRTGNIIIFGGTPGTNGCWMTGTWALKGSVWTNQNPGTSPPGRCGASMAFDRNTDEVVVYGGLASDGNLLNDTWTR
jgi:hypothetical protein